MPSRHLRLDLPAKTVPERVRVAFARLRRELSIPADFPPEVLDEAAATVLRDEHAHDRVDLRHLPFVTIDPPGSKDLDQAVHLSRGDDGGYVVDYAIADVGRVVLPGGAVDAEAHVRGVTFYAPDGRTPLHPPALSEDAASLLPDVDRAAAAWRVTLDDTGEIVDVAVRRALVRSRAQLTYTEVQDALDGGPDDHAATTATTAAETTTSPPATSPPAAAPAPGGAAAPYRGMLALLREIGTLREALERDRGGVSIDVPEQDVTLHADGSYSIELRSVLPAEGWNAQISLLTGIAAARLMRAGEIGILRTLPVSDPRDVERLRRTARAVGIEWAPDVPYADLLGTLDSRVPQHAAFLNEATSLFRGAGYLAFQGPVPEGSQHAAIAAEYSHVTAPLRRLVDRYTTEICLALSAGAGAGGVPSWVVDAFDDLPKTMARSGQRASSFERAGIDIVEAALLTDRVGETFRGVVVDVDSKDPRKGLVVVDDPAVRGTVTSGSHDLPLGESVEVELTEVSIESRKIRFDYGG